MSNLFMQVTTSAKSFAPPLSPPLSPNIFKNKELSLASSSSSSMSIPKNEEYHHNEQKLPPTKSKSKNKYRMKICDAPPELLEFIKRSEEKYKKSLPNKSSFIINVSNVIKSGEKNEKPLPNKSPYISTSAKSNDQKIPSFRKTNEKRRRFRKNPYPKKAPSSSSPGITLQVDVYSTLKKDPKALLEHSTSSSDSSLFFTDSESESDTKSSPPQSPISQRTSSIKGKITKIRTTTNSLARVLADRGLLGSTTVTAAEIKLIRIPPPPSIQFDELMRNIEQLNPDSTMLHQITPKIHWGGQPLSISHLPHNNFLHPKEAYVASTLRITPIQYLTAKHILISSARRYAQKFLPFRKSDAQKLLKIDVNKASKLWEFFNQLNWIN